MTTPGITARRLVFLLMLPGCHTWRPVALAPNTGYEQNGKLRVEREHTTNSVITARQGSTGAPSARVVFHGAWVDGDTLFGWQSDRSKRHAVAIADVRRAEERRFSGGRTTLLVVGVGVGLFAGLIALVAATPPVSWQ
jgi:hypothetical protein